MWFMRALLMNLGERIKLIRGATSRDKFAPLTGISKNTLVNYEMGDRTPSADYLAKILELFPDISPAWLLIGEGDRKRHKPITKGSENGLTDTYTDKYRKIRGNLTIAEFAKKLSITESQVEALEKGELTPDVYLLSSTCFHFNINPSWLIEDFGPMTKDEMEKRPQLHIDRQTFMFALHAANSMKKVFKESGQRMTQEQWGMAVISTYESSLNYETLVSALERKKGQDE